MLCRCCSLCSFDNRSCVSSWCRRQKNRQQDARTELLDNAGGLYGRQASELSGPLEKSTEIQWMDQQARELDSRSKNELQGQDASHEAEARKVCELHGRLPSELEKKPDTSPA